MTEIVAKRILRNELSVEQKADRDVSYIYFYPEHMTGMDAVKEKFGDTDKDVLLDLIPDIIKYAQITGPTKYKFMENPAGVPIIFMANSLFVDIDNNEMVYDINVELGKPRGGRRKSEVNETAADEKKFLALAKKVPLFRTAKRRKAA